MDWLYIVIIFVACLYIVPKLIVFCLCIILRKFSFYASVGGPLTLNNMMLRIPLKMNFALLIRVEQIQIKIGWPSLGLFQSSDKLFRIHTNGLQVNLLLRDDFDKWNDSKIELLHVIEQFRTRMKRLGMLNDHNTASAENARDENSTARRQPMDDAADKKANDWSETIKNLLDSSTLVAENTQVNFFVYKMDHLDEFHRNIDEVNVPMFYIRCI